MITLTKEEAQQVLDLITRYRTETPLGNQPHMIAHKAEEAIETLRARLALHDMNKSAEENGEEL